MMAKDVNLEAAAHLRVMVDCVELVQQLLSGLPWLRLDLAASIEAARRAGHDLHIIILAGSPLDLAHLQHKRTPILVMGIHVHASAIPSNRWPNLYLQPFTRLCGIIAEYSIIVVNSVGESANACRELTRPSQTGTGHFFLTAEHDVAKV